MSYRTSRSFERFSEIDEYKTILIQAVASISRSYEILGSQDRRIKSLERLVGVTTTHFRKMP